MRVLATMATADLLESEATMLQGTEQRGEKSKVGAGSVKEGEETNLRSW